MSCDGRALPVSVLFRFTKERERDMTRNGRSCLRGVHVREIDLSQSARTPRPRRLAHLSGAHPDRAHAPRAHALQSDAARRRAYFERHVAVGRVKIRRGEHRHHGAPRLPVGLDESVVAKEAQRETALRRAQREPVARGTRALARAAVLR